MVVIYTVFQFTWQILTQWDRKLNSQAREYLQQVMKEGATSGGGAGEASGGGDVYQQKLKEK